MIDYFALALGHGLLAIAMLRLVQREALDVDPVIEDVHLKERDEQRAKRERRHRKVGAPRSSSPSGSAANARSSSPSGSAVK